MFNFQELGHGSLSTSHKAQQKEQPSKTLLRERISGERLALCDHSYHPKGRTLKTHCFHSVQAYSDHKCLSAEGSTFSQSGEKLQRGQKFNLILKRTVQIVLLKYSIPVRAEANGKSNKTLTVSHKSLPPPKAQCRELCDFQI